MILDKSKICSKCNELQLIFNTANICINCHRVAVKKYKEKNKEKTRKQSKKYRERNKENIKSRNKKRYEENKHELIQKQKEYRERNKDRIKFRNEENKEKIRQQQKNYRERNKQTILKKRNKYYINNKNEILENNLKYKESHKEELKEYSKAYYKNNKEQILNYSKTYYNYNKKKINAQRNEYQKIRRKTDPIFKLRMSISGAVYQALKANNFNKDGSILCFLPFKINELKQHLELQFEDWMNWDNWGKYNSIIWDNCNSNTWTWNVDHIVPQSKFPYNSMEHPNFKKCWALSNLRPLGAKQNIMEGDRK